jgi:hypothetical protein
LLENIIPIIVFVTVCIGVFIFTHMHIKKFLLAIIVAGLGGAVLFLLIGTIVMGYLDPFFIIALKRIISISFLVAFLVGSVFYFRGGDSNTENKR